jgi:hypothetical protein
MVVIADIRVDRGGKWYLRVARIQEILLTPSKMHIHTHKSTSR